MLMAWQVSVTLFRNSSHLLCKTGQGHNVFKSSMGTNISFATSKASIKDRSFSQSERHIEIWFANHVNWKGRLLNESLRPSPRRSTDTRTLLIK